MVTLAVKEAEVTIATKSRAGGIEPTSFRDEPVADPFSDIRTEYKQTKFYQEEFGLVVISSIIIPTTGSPHNQAGLPWRRGLIDATCRGCMGGGSVI